MIAKSIFHCVNIPKAGEWANVVKLDPWHVWLAETHDRKNCMTTDCAKLPTLTSLDYVHY